MVNVPGSPQQLREIEMDVPSYLDAVLDKAFLSAALGHLSGGSDVLSVTVVDTIQAMASKIRIELRFVNRPEHCYYLCIKGFLDQELDSIVAHTTTLREAGFYGQIAPHVNMESPACVAIVRDSRFSRCLIFLTDLINEGAHFYHALEPFSLDQMAETLDQLARLHARAGLLKGRAWIPSRLQELASRESPETWLAIRDNMRDGRQGDLPEEVLDASRLKAGITALAHRNRGLPRTLLHGDCHLGNVYCCSEGVMGFTDWQLVQKGHWSLDVAYHIASSLALEQSERQEQALLRHYLAALQVHGGQADNFEQAWEHYRCALIYAYYHWAIASRADRDIIGKTFYRLASAVVRCDSYRCLGL